MAVTEHYDVGIIGAGVHGAAAAFHLTGAGVRTVLFERDHPASGPTGRSSAVCRAYYTNPFLAEVARDALGMFRNFDELTGGGHAGYHETGVLFLHGADDIADVEATAAHLNAIGTAVEVLAPDELQAIYADLVADEVGCAVWEPRGGHADPVGTTTALYRAAVERGLTTRLRTEVVAIEEEPDAVVVVDNRGGRTVCDRLLIAAGPWTRRLARMVGVELPLTVERHWIVTCGWGPATPVPFVLADLPGDYYATPEGTELLCIGPLSAEPEVDPDDFDERVHAEEAERMLTPASRRIPTLADATFRGGWASLYDVSPDWQPVIGAIAPNVFVDAGTSGHGFKLAPALGRHVADLVRGEDTDARLAEFSPSRFADGRAVAAGFGETKIIG